MNIPRQCILCITFLFFTGTLTAQAQDEGHMVWKKRVARLIDTRDTLDAKGHLHKKEYGDTLLAKLLIDAILDSSITPYKIADESKIQQLEIDDIKYKIHGEPDSVYSSSGLRDSVVFNRPIFQYKDAKTYRVWEDWRFDPMNREMKIQVLGIELYRDEFLKSGDYLGSMPLFFIHWENAKDILNQLKRKNPQNNIQRYLWDSYFKKPGLFSDTQSIDTIIPSTTENILTKRAIRDVEIKGDPDSFRNNNKQGWTSNEMDQFFEWFDKNEFHEENENITIGQLIYDSLYAGRLNAYYDLSNRLTDILPFDSIGFKIMPDTVFNEELDKQTLVYHDIDWYRQFKYSLLEEWSFDTENGKTTIHLLGIEPRLDLTDIEYIRIKNPYFWVRYEDVKDMLHHYDEYHPLNNLSTALWQSYFKPEQNSR